MPRRLGELIRRTPLLGSLAASSPAQYLVRTVRAARAVDEPFRFTVLQLSPPRTARYRLRDSGLTVFLRHRTRDVDIFKEVFGTGYGANSYDPPEPVAAALAGRPRPAVLDLGGNIGLFGAYAIGRWPGATVHSFEPDPSNLPILERVIAVNGLQRRWTVSPVAVAARVGEMPFVAGLFAESQLAAVAETAPDAERGAQAAALEDGRTIAVRVVDLFEQDHDVDLMKMDIEGGEWSILTDPRLAELRADAIVLEWHAVGCPEPDPRAATIGLLRSAGYTEIEETEDLGHRGVLWAWRPSSAPNGP
ncbi:MAG: FkbM family methyltransferase [Solirubrobacteraceae bacterium]